MTSPSARAMGSPSCALLVVSCDRYRDLWPPYFDLLRRMWPDRPIPAYLLTNEVHAEIEGVTTLAVGDDKSWSDNVLFAISKIDADFIFLCLEDLMIVERVDTANFNSLLEWMAAVNANYLRIIPGPPPDRPYDGRVGIASKGTLYRTSTEQCVWRREALRALLVPGESAWDFEVYGTIRSDEYDGFFAANRPIIRYLNTVIKGKWERGAVRRVLELGAPVDLHARRVMTRREHLILRAQQARAKLSRLIPARHRRAVKTLLFGRGHKYHAMLNR